MINTTYNGHGNEINKIYGKEEDSIQPKSKGIQNLGLDDDSVFNNMKNKISKRIGIGLYVNSQVMP